MKLKKRKDFKIRITVFAVVLAVLIGLICAGVAVVKNRNKGNEAMPDSSSAESRTATEDAAETNPSGAAEGQTEQQSSTQPSTEPLIPQNGLSDQEYVDEILSQMTLDEKIYQMMFVTPESITGVGQVVQAGEGTRQALQQYPVGGIIYFGQNIESREQLATMISNSQSYSKIPLFIGVDEEGGRVSRLSGIGVTKQPPMKEIGDSGDAAKAYEVGSTLGKDLMALGFNVNFAPDADVLVNSANSVIGDRSFGSDPKLVADMTAQEVKGLQDNGVSATLKHFPGHGSTYTDSHTGYSESTRTMEELRNCEFLPFKAGIDAGADFVMTAHITLVNATEEKVPASLSKELISGCLIGELGFEGIVITDSFRMGAIAGNYTMAQAVVKAIDAGVDMILMPTDVSAAHSALKNAVSSGTLTEERINQSVRKILLTKAKRNIL